MLDVQHLFQQTDLADVDLFITLDVSGSSASVPMEVDGEREAVVDAVLQRFPAHKAILDASAYFRAQVTPCRVKAASAAVAISC